MVSVWTETESEKRKEKMKKLILAAVIAAVLMISFFTASLVLAEEPCSENPSPSSYWPVCIKWADSPAEYYSRILLFWDGRKNTHIFFVGVRLDPGQVEWVRQHPKPGLWYILDGAMPPGYRYYLVNQTDGRVWLAYGKNSVASISEMEFLVEMPVNTEILVRAEFEGRRPPVTQRFVIVGCGDNYFCPLFPED